MRAQYRCQKTAAVVPGRVIVPNVAWSTSMGSPAVWCAGRVGDVGVARRLEEDNADAVTMSGQRALEIIELADQGHIDQADWILIDRHAGDSTLDAQIAGAADTCAADAISHVAGASRVAAAVVRHRSCVMRSLRLHWPRTRQLVRPSRR